MNEFKDFAIFRDKADWQSYKSLLSKELVGESVINNEDVIHFPKPPKEYPCLAASIVVMGSNDLEPNKNRYKVNCCYVYRNDANKLLDVYAELNTESEVEPELAVASSAIQLGGELESALGNLKSAAEYVESSMALVAILAKELDSIGAAKLDKVLPEAKKLLETIKNDSSFDVLNYLTGTE